MHGIADGRLNKTDWGVAGRICSTIQTARSAQRQKSEAREPSFGGKDCGHARSEQTRRVVDQCREEARGHRRRWRWLRVRQPSPRLQSSNDWQPEIVGRQSKRQKTVYERSDGVSDDTTIDYYC